MDARFGNRLFGVCGDAPRAASAGGVWLPATALAVLLLAAGVVETAAQDFRIQSRVYKGDDEEPISQNLTLFRGGVVYDFLSEPEETAVFDRPRGNKPGRFILLDPARQVQTEVPLDKVQRFMSNLQLWVASQSDPFLRFLSRPEFKEEFDQEQQAWNYTSPWMSYQISGAPAEDDGLFAQYDHFSDWFVRLNTMLTIKTRAPYGLGRLAVNASLRARKEIPSAVVLTVNSPNRFFRRKITYRSEHQLTTMISQSDQARINEAQLQLVQFKRLDLEDYLQPPKE